MGHKRQIEVNYYRWHPGLRKTPVRRLDSVGKPFQVVLLCELCRNQLTGRVEVQDFGAELDVDALSCTKCGHTMYNREAAAVAEDRRRAG